MRPILEDAVLGSDLDCQFFTIRNMGRLLPAPTAFVDIDDPRLSDPRPIVNNTVTDESVASTAGIEQSKLDFNGTIPTAWLGTAANQVARGDLVERAATKAQPSGYASLDAGGLLPAASVTVGGGAGKVNSVNLIMPSELSVANSPIESAGTFAVTWKDEPDNSWFGGGTIGLSSVLLPMFKTSVMPMDLIPDLAATKFTTGTFNVARLPVAVGIGASHAQGIVPDPGEKGDANDYLGRDMQWHAFTGGSAIQPTVPDVLITLNFTPLPQGGTGVSNLTVRTQLKGSVLFYRVNGGAFIEVHDTSVSFNAADGDFIEAYASKPGYNNSAIATYVAQPSIS